VVVPPAMAPVKQRRRAVSRDMAAWILVAQRSGYLLPGAFVPLPKRGTLAHAQLKALYVAEKVPSAKARAAVPSLRARRGRPSIAPLVVPEFYATAGAFKVRIQQRKPETRDETVQAMMRAVDRPTFPAWKGKGKVSGL